MFLAHFVILLASWATTSPGGPGANWPTPSEPARQPSSTSSACRPSTTARSTPDVAAIVNDAMTAATTTSAAAIVAAYDFSQIGTLVDVGGGHGLLLASILKTAAEMRGILFELPYVVDGARDLLRREGVVERCAVIAGDFFDAVPEGGDVYILKGVIHDWDDERASHILRNCHHAMRPQTKLLLVEGVITPGDEPDAGKFTDLEMLVLTPYGKERTAAEFEELYSKAGFRLTRVVPTMSPLSIIEGVRV
jgi:O-methyltransferase domain